jgi:hypothetical protein
MKIKISTEFSVPDQHHKIQRDYFFPSLRSAALVLGCNPRHLSDQLKGKRSETLSEVGTVIKIEAHHEHTETDSIACAIREHSPQPKKDPTLGLMEIGRGWGRVEQALEQITAAGKWIVRKFYKPKHVE